MRKCVLLFISVLLIFSLTACSLGGRAEKGKIVVAGKKFTEQVILTHLLAEYLKAKMDLDVQVKEGLGSTFILHQALVRGDVDLYVEYTGTGYLNILKNKYNPSQTPDEIYEATKKGYKEKYNIAWLKPLGFNNTYALALRKELADQLNVKTCSDLVKHSNKLVFGADAEFFERSDGYDALVDTYGFNFKRAMNIDPDLQYEAAQKGDIDVITAFTTDARIKQFGLTVLKDDKNFFPPYYAVPIVRQEVLDANPGLEEALNKLEGILTDEKMMELNAQVNIEGKSPKQVAIDFLKSEGLID
ncbi:glycine betaine ABC transporter substrate-binding protein [Thermosediminibacter oceani]|uniref:Substrate-binding region of ABC-type glycine betaine transport system n=1 Tax=Thermosediminibacter oceani (strain ATCC BAA-1034 / DSM 16646 / JW/IW-1228P) TaxID=555079 RepID=D9S083_THEOJ|nr:glycine betaine ABC transporter substrate-binding protein [Thermosediminibacter oceani]ADL07011.1 Substrate-binding region of ABC-type glycine betaine transport system [Thermosediminibacter oceani DSM 16646]